jgi:hypothetical protein
MKYLYHLLSESEVIFYTVNLFQLTSFKSILKLPEKFRWFSFGLKFCEKTTESANGIPNGRFCVRCIDSNVI